MGARSAPEARHAPARGARNSKRLTIVEGLRSKDRQIDDLQEWKNWEDKCSGDALQSGEGVICVDQDGKPGVDWILYARGAGTPTDLPVETPAELPLDVPEPEDVVDDAPNLDDGYDMDYVDDWVDKANENGWDVDKLRDEIVKDSCPDSLMENAEDPEAMKESCIDSVDEMLDGRVE